ncbi:MAG: L-glyceraldehyde 3-phosphate reductase [Bacteroidetes bacterium HGW-Bacteroidetes-1]|jgi:L-glyceraldehyde 3-phosphate reductase|nr:MAG: L-glyceraldehyde 3-phosphate reductase [Bacteroidetes bacterium HGW-Bacteroidetes-1]
MENKFIADSGRYKTMKYNRCGKSGLLLPAISLGLWHNFGHVDSFNTARDIIRSAFNQGVTHFDLANNYGPPAGSAEEVFGSILKSDLASYRDEMIITTKAGYGMWNGPYGEWGSRKYLVASLNQSLKRMGLDYVDIFYSHRFDPNTPLEETMMALDYMVRSGKALYAGISNYSPEQTKNAIEILNKLGTPCLIHQGRYSMIDRTLENGLLDVLEENGVGFVAYSPLAQGILTDRYLKGIPSDSRASKAFFLKPENITPQLMEKVDALNEIAMQRGQTLAQMATAWLQRDSCVTSVIVGVSSVKQLDDNIEALKNIAFSDEEKTKIQEIIETM